MPQATARYAKHYQDAVAYDKILIPTPRVFRRAKKNVARWR